jgi:C-terminal processing protease CtpA/Prc
LNFYCRDPEQSVTFLKILSFNFDNAQSQIDEIFRDILKNGDKHLILDLQNNTGGSLETTSYFLSYLLARSHRVADHVHRRSLEVEAAEHFHWADDKRQSQFGELTKTFRRVANQNGVHSLPIAKRSFGHPHFSSRVTVLVNEFTASAAVATASLLRRYQDALVIGGVPAGSSDFSCAAPFGQYRLPHSGLVLFVPADCFSTRNGFLNSDSRMKPDIVVPVTKDNMGNHPLAVARATMAQLGMGDRLAKTETGKKSAGEPIVFLIREDYEVKTAKDLNGAAICFVRGSDAEKHLRTFYTVNKMIFEDIWLADHGRLERAYSRQKCDAAVAVESRIWKIRGSMRDPKRYLVLPDNIRN